VLSGFLNEIFNQKDNSTRRTGQRERTLGLRLANLLIPRRAEMQMTEDELTDPTEEVRRVKFISLDGIDEQSQLEDRSMREIMPNDSWIPALDVREREKVLSLLTQRMAELPDLPKKVLAMYYYENMRLSEIATCCRLTESRICQILNQTVAVLRNYLLNLLT
jgi:RNA polymerase sigma factor FliA